MTQINAHELIEWLRERHDNCCRIAAQKTAADKAGWLEDAAYFEATIVALGRSQGIEYPRPKTGQINRQEK